MHEGMKMKSYSRSWKWLSSHSWVSYLDPHYLVLLISSFWIADIKRGHGVSYLCQLPAQDAPDIPSSSSHKRSLANHATLALWTSKHAYALQHVFDV